jgi:glutathionylspermidine synthase
MWELHNMCLAAVDKVVKDDALLDAFEIPLTLRDAVKQSWQHKQPDLIGRFDLLVSGSEPPKLLEYNADTPTLLVEAGLVQADWAAHLGVKQFNRIDELLVASWPRMLKRAAAAWGRSVESLQPVLFAAHRTSLEEADNIDYLAATARRAGLAATSCDIDHVKIPDSSLAPVVEAPGTKSPARVKAIWKLYPYEWLAEEELGEALQGSAYAHNAADPSGCLWMEPPWKLVLSNKALLPMLWQMFPGHPNLLPAFWTAQEASWHEAQVRTNDHYEDEYGWVAKPKYGREGVGILYSFDFPNMDAFDDQVHAMLEAFDATRHHYDPESVKKVQQNAQAARLLAAARQSNFTSCNVETQAVTRQSQDDDSREGWARSHGVQAMRHDVPFPPLGGAIFQEYFDTPTYCGRQCVVGGFIVYGEPAGLTFREDNLKTTNDFSCFVPHMLEDTLKEPLAVTVIASSTLKLSGVDDITGQYVRHGFYNGRPSYKHATLGDVYLLFDGTAWTFSPTEQANLNQIIGKFSVQGANATGFSTANSLGSLMQCEMYHAASDSFKAVDLTVKPQITVAKASPQRKISSHELALRKALYGEPVSSEHRRVGSTSRTWYGRPISYVVQERPNYQQANNMGAGGTGGAGGAGGVSYASGAASEANKHHARHTSNENLRPAQQYTGPRRQTGSYARYSGAHSGGGSGGS